MDLSTIIKAIAIVGDVTPAAMTLYQGFIAATAGTEDQATLKRLYAEARSRSDELHAEVQSL